MAKKKSRIALIRLRQFKVDELRKEMGVLESERAQIVSQQTKLEDQVVREQALMRENAAKGIETRGDFGTFTYGGFAQRVIDTRAKLAQDLAEKDAEIDALRGKLQAAFLELKQVEVMAERAEARAKAEAASAEQAAFDEAGLQNFVRKH